ncbi:MarR family transcriptional regulator [Nocardioides sp. TRM66260-LWL]|uniref:MarR family winged helix-turn-helix transcriptional regulator n=1 Tax=Nocardioides sp. TRM66260-LWL TaxID=2874478 RepID=UPI001CC49C41|nr:MarR family transcriptional regulator [Nocardioides sp. TRM66260-LWL]MBZ5734083.1 MarR family transcriptional regulator [Nocardioides sp. TRM66260-LWL]
MARPDPLDDDQIEAYLAIMEVAGQLRFRLDADLGGALSYLQFEMLGRLRRASDDGLRMTDLADRVAVSRSGLTYQVGKLEAAGLVTRTASRDDDRSNVVHLTEAGRREFDRLLPGHVEIVRSLLFDGLPDDDVAALARIVGHIRDRIRALPPRSTSRRADT